MKIHMIVVQYNQRYPGEYMPNVVDVWDEYTMDENPDGYLESLRKHEAMVPKDYEAVRELIVHVPDDAITSLFDIPETIGRVEHVY